jgi:YggT family protein
MNFNPFINLISSILSIYSFLLISYVILYYLLMFKIVNPYSPIVRGINKFLIRIIEPVLEKIRRFVKPFAGVDLSIIVLFLLIYFTRDVLYSYFYVYR